MGSEVFMVQAPLTNNGTIIYGRNSLSFCCKEISYFSANENGTTKFSTVEVTSTGPTFAYILNGTCGSNEKNVSISTLFADKKPEKGLSALDLTKLVLERAENADGALDVVTKLIEDYNEEVSVAQYSFFICDMNTAYVLDIFGNLWAAEKITEAFRAFSNGFGVTTKIDKKSENLGDKLKDLGLYDGSGELNFSHAVSMTASESKWPCEEPTSGFNAQQMFEVLRCSAEKSSQDIASSFVGVLKEPISVHWFTGTENPRESVFKPFIFTSDVRISPLTTIKSEEDEPLLRQLHSNRKWDQVGDLLKTLEKSCVDEVDGFADNVPTPELDELLKDCVEAEVKFYR
ncbi:unnamed protein product [Chironomus riparius]|uniref:Uncharacterized protein n=1 Tax=Chironomus riparius TaxID=315576 RepID=A0A9N9RZ30_9DIPT|nr:unnamed protein product [Chironomus riparius]